MTSVARHATFSSAAKAGHGTAAGVMEGVGRIDVVAVAVVDRDFRPQQQHGRAARGETRDAQSALPGESTGRESSGRHRRRAAPDVRMRLRQRRRHPLHLPQVIERDDAVVPGAAFAGALAGQRKRRMSAVVEVGQHPMIHPVARVDGAVGGAGPVGAPELAAVQSRAGPDARVVVETDDVRIAVPVEVGRHLVVAVGACARVPQLGDRERFARRRCRCLIAERTVAGESGDVADRRIGQLARRQTGIAAGVRIGIVGQHAGGSVHGQHRIHANLVDVVPGDRTQVVADGEREHGVVRGAAAVGDLGLDDVVAALR